MKKISRSKKVISSKNKKEIPVWIKVISVYYFIIAFFSIIAGVYILAFKQFSLLILEDYGLPIASPGMLAGIGVLVVAIGAFYVFVGKNLWNGKNWARIATILICSLGVLYSLANLFYGELGGIFFILIDGFIVGYLVFNKDVKKAFS